MQSVNQDVLLCLSEAVLLMAAVDAVAVVVMTDIVLEVVVIVVAVVAMAAVVSAVVAVVLSSSDYSIECTTIYHNYVIKINEPNKL